MKFLQGPIAQATVRTSAMLGLRLFAQAGTLLLLTRMLGPANFGRFSAVAALALLLGLLANAGTHLTLLRDLSLDATRRAQLLPAVLGTTLACGALLFVLYLPLVLLLRIDVAPSAIICIGASELLLQPFLAVRSAEYQAQGEIARSQLLTTIPLLLRLLAVGALYVLHANSLRLYAICYLLAAAIALILAGLRSNASWPAPATWRLLSATQFRDNGGYALLNAAAAGPNEIDKPLATKLLPSTSAGTYAAATRVAGALILPVMAMMMSALPRLFRESGSDNHRGLLRLIFAVSLAYGLLAGAGMWLFATPLESLFGENYAGIAGNLHWLAFAVPGMCLRIAATSSLMAEDRPWLRIATELLGCACIFGFSFGMAHSSVMHFMPLTILCSEWVMAACAWYYLLNDPVSPANTMA